MDELTVELQQEYQMLSIVQLSKKLFENCKKGNIHHVKYLLTSPDLIEHPNIHALNDCAFRSACLNGHLAVVTYLLTSPELKEHADIDAKSHAGFISACQNGHLNVVRYLLTSPELNYHADRDTGFQFACEFGQLEIVKYLLTSAELSEHADIHADNDYGFTLACKNHQISIICYLLLLNGEYAIPFQQTKWNLSWAMNNQYDDIVTSMMHNLKNNDPLKYLECLPHLQNYNSAVYKKIQQIAIDGEEINSSVPELYL